VFQTANLPAPSGSGPLQSLFVPETIRLSAREIITINNIRLAIAEKVKALERIDAALEKDWAAYKALEKMLTGSEDGYLSYNGVAAVKQRIHSVIQNQEQSKEVLRNSIAKLEDVLAAFGFKVEPTPGR
jgi:hypothetical protein